MFYKCRRRQRQGAEACGTHYMNIAVQERQTLASHLEHNLAEVDAVQDQRRIEIGDDVLGRVAAHLREGLMSDSPEHVRRVLGRVLLRVELARNEMTPY